MSLLVVGTVAIDTIETPGGRADNALGGSAAFAAYVGSFFTTPRLVSVVGDDFPDDYRRLLAGRGVDLGGLATDRRGTFRWTGRYHQDMNVRDTLEVHLNCIEHFDPVLPPAYRDTPYVFLANCSPVVQARVLDQVQRPRLVLLDTMDLWINITKEPLLALLKRVDGLCLNDSEARMLTGQDNLVRAGRAVRELGPRFVVLKKGEHGAMLFSDDGVFVMPAFPLATVTDPTGAGDSFAGTILGYLAAENAGRDNLGPRLRRAMAYGTVVASFTVEGFGLDRLRQLDRRAVDARLEQYRAMVAL